MALAARALVVSAKRQRNAIWLDANRCSAERTAKGRCAATVGHGVRGSPATARAPSSNGRHAGIPPGGSAPGGRG